jgi:hypothetical protein
MITEWRNPRLVSQYSESNAETIHIKWDDSNGYAGLRSSNGSSVGTLGKLIHIARSPKPDIVNKTYYIKMTNYSFTNLSNTINGIELKLLSKRVGRITDDTVSLSNITKQIIEDPSFGVVLRFKSHPEWPHSDPMDLISVQLRIH